MPGCEGFRRLWNGVGVCRHAVLGAFLLLAAWPVCAEFYIAGELGAHGSPDILLRSGDTDRASRCDEFVNPRFAELDGCTATARGDGAVDDWMSRFDGASGVVAAAAVGFRIADRWRLELELLHRDTGVNASSSILSPEGIAFTRIFGAELPQASETIDSLSSRNLFANVYFDWPSMGAWTPFVGLGAGVGFAALDYAALWQRSANPNDVESASGLPNEQEVRRNLAGTASIAGGRLRDRLRGLQLLAGVDYAFSQSLSLTLQARWASFAPFEGGGVYEQLRSHASQLRRDGSEPVRYRTETNDTAFFALGMRLRKSF